MIDPLHLYFADLLGDRCRLDPPTIVFDNARLPAPLPEEDDNTVCCADVSCHTRATVLTTGSTSSHVSTSSYTSTGSQQSVHSNNSNSSSNCRWDSNPSSKDSGVRADSCMRRPQRPNRQPTSPDYPQQRPQSPPPTTIGVDRPRPPPKRTLSVEETEEVVVVTKTPPATADSSSACSNRAESAAVGQSLKEMFRTRQRHEQRSTSPPAVLPALSGRRSPNMATVNEILGESTQELKITW